MKKYLAVLIAIFICLFVPMCTYASQSGFETTVPKTHTVSIEAEHASASYIEGEKGLSTAYPVPRSSQPQFQITADEGYTIKRVLLNGEDVTSKMANGILKLPEVYENQVIEIETEAIPEDPVEPTSAPVKPSSAPVTPSPTTPVTPSLEPESTNAQMESEEPVKENEQEETMQTESAESEPQISPENEKTMNFWWIVLLLLLCIIVSVIFLIIKRKKDKDEKKNL